MWRQAGHIEGTCGMWGAHRGHTGDVGTHTGDVEGTCGKWGHAWDMHGTHMEHVGGGDTQRSSRREGTADTWDTRRHRHAGDTGVTGNTEGTCTGTFGRQGTLEPRDTQGTCRSHSWDPSSGQQGGAQAGTVVPPVRGQRWGEPSEPQATVAGATYPVTAQEPWATPPSSHVPAIAVTFRAEKVCQGLPTWWEVQSQEVTPSLSLATLQHRPWLAGTQGFGDRLCDKPTGAFGNAPALLWGQQSHPTQVTLALPPCEPCGLRSTKLLAPG